MSAPVQIIAEGWQPAVIAPYDTVLMTRFKRGREVMERQMVRLRERLWWDIPYSQYAHEEPFEYTEFDGGSWP